jgi:hypothetical protein
MNRAWTIAFWVMWGLLLASWILALCGLVGGRAVTSAGAMGGRSGLLGRGLRPQDREPHAAGCPALRELGPGCSSSARPPTSDGTPRPRRPACA